MYHQYTMQFSERIVKELDIRGWSRSEAARRGKISPSMLDKVINGYSEPGIKFLKGISQAFNIPLGEVISWLDPSAYGDLSPKKRELIRLAEQSDDEAVEMALAVLEAAWERKKRK